MIRKILIANRGEIAVRIIRACREMNIETVAIYSKGDTHSLHTQIADEAVCIGDVRSVDSYLKIDRIIETAVSKNCDAIHPGVGFLSENKKFAKLCEDIGIKFIGPSSDVIDSMGDKAKAREIMIKNKVPVVPGSKTAVKSLEDAKKQAKDIGYPILIKASAGGGGRGMRVADDESQFDSAFQTASSEALQAFGDDTMYLEKFIINPRHIEFQILGDSHGNVIHLGERECSMQRRNQKVLEESPSVALSEELRDAMGQAAVLAARAVNYENAGTIEYIVAGDDFYFIEMNTRIQVEHPVTEMVTGIDLIKEQIKIASGKKLEYKQEDVKLRGHSIEVRINAENPKKDFAPHPGKIELFNVPNGFNVRFDSHIYQGYSIPPYYDSMIGKLIVHGKTRKEAIRKIRAALEELVIEGVSTNMAFQYMLLHNPKFVKGNFDTGFIANNIEALLNYEEQ